MEESGDDEDEDKEDDEEEEGERMAQTFLDFLAFSLFSSFLVQGSRRRPTVPNGCYFLSCRGNRLGCSVGY